MRKALDRHKVYITARRFSGSDSRMSDSPIFGRIRFLNDLSGRPSRHCPVRILSKAAHHEVADRSLEVAADGIWVPRGSHRRGNVAAFSPRLHRVFAIVHPMTWR